VGHLSWPPIETEMEHRKEGEKRAQSFVDPLNQFFWGLGLSQSVIRAHIIITYQLAVKFGKAFALFGYKNTRLARV